MNWGKLKRPVIATFKNSNFQSLCELEKTWKDSLRLRILTFLLRPRFKSPNFESIDELGVMY